jgi:uncharacterized protein YjbI with pentapeptide repeats
MSVTPIADDRRRRLRADCASCFALCCVVPAFSMSVDFAIDKPAGEPCPNLLPDRRCGIHAHLRDQGFGGCVAYDCFGAGQQVSQVTFGGRDWRENPSTAREMFQVFPIMRQLHELLWHVTQALAMRSARPTHDDLATALEQTERLTRATPAELLRIDVAAHHGEVNALLSRASELVRASVRPPKADRREADLIGKDLTDVDLSGANLRGALLVGADLRRADLRLADVTGADLRGANLVGADLREALFLTQSQLDAARGDTTTKLPASLLRPQHWTAAS